MARLARATKKISKRNRDESGIALFMVIGAVAVLAIVVSEFTYIAQVAQMIAFGGLDQTQAHYLAKSGLKLSLLRLKAYKQVKEKAEALGISIPHAVREKIWSFPFTFPIPTNIPGLTTLEKEGIEKFQKDMNMDGSFSAAIESETSKYNVNMLLENYSSMATPTSSPTQLPAPNFPNNPAPNTPPGALIPQPAQSFDPKAARESLANYLGEIIKNKSIADDDFSSEYRDIRPMDLVDGIAAWVDRSYEHQLSSSLEKVPMKKAPMYTISELRMVPQIDDELYALFSPTLTARVTSEININTMKEPTLRALIPQMTNDDVKEFFKYRDSLDSENKFVKVEDFYNYLGTSVGAFQNRSQTTNQLQEEFQKRNIILTTEETEFKITVKAQVNQSVRIIEAWVSLAMPAKPKAGVPGGAPAETTPPEPDPGLRITYMRIY